MYSQYGTQIDKNIGKDILFQKLWEYLEVYPAEKCMGYVFTFIGFLSLVITAEVFVSKVFAGELLKYRLQGPYSSKI